ncbi:MAG: hypothetical protein V3U72_05285 [Candidatus Aenigmarchaeota archaeon]
MTDENKIAVLSVDGKSCYIGLSTYSVEDRGGKLFAVGPLVEGFNLGKEEFRLKKPESVDGGMRYHAISV